MEHDLLHLQRLKGFLESLHPVSPALLDFLKHNLRYKFYKKNEVLLKRGQVSKHVWYLSSGLVRAWYKNEDSEVTFWLLQENSIIPENVGPNRVARYNYQALEDSETLCISYEDIIHLTDHFPEYLRLSLDVTKRYYELHEQRTQLLYIKSLEERYNQLLKNNGELCNRVPVKYLASYLGMESNTLSIIRKRKKNR